MPLKAIKFFFILVSAILLPFLTVAQIVTVQPATASLDDTITITYDASAGNQALLNCNGSVYMHTGVITGKSLDGHDWKHVVGNWGQDDSRVKMISVSKNIWQKKLVIRRFYSLSPDEKVLQLSFVFRNQNGSKVGKTANNDDILVSVNGYTPPVTKAVSYRWKTRSYVSHHLSNGVLNIETTHGLVQAIPYSGKIVEIKNFPGSLPEKDTSAAVVLTPQNPSLTMKELPDWLLLKTDSLTVVFHKNPFYATFIYNNDSLLQENYGYFERTDNNGLQFKISENEKLYGLGERAIDFSLTGHRYPLFVKVRAAGGAAGAKN
jgi:hypothetical protein